MVLANITVDKIRVENSNLICFKVTDIEYLSGKHFDSTTEITLGFDKIAGSEVKKRKPKSTNWILCDFVRMLKYAIKQFQESPAAMNHKKTQVTMLSRKRLRLASPDGNAHVTI